MNTIFLISNETKRIIESAWTDLELAKAECDRLSQKYPNCEILVVELETNKPGKESPPDFETPSHYGGNDNPFEPFKIIDYYHLDFYVGNVVKYILRAGRKANTNEVDDIKKAIHYLNERLKRIEK